MKTLKIYTDGASRGNPGKSGIGIIIYNDTGKIILKYQEYIGHATNNIAEYTSLLKSLDLIEKLNKSEIIEHINFYTDSELISNQINGKYKVKNIELKKHYDRFNKKIRELKISYTIKHIDRTENKEADKLANKAIDEKGKRLKKI